MRQLQVLEFKRVPLRDEHLSFLAGMTNLKRLRTDNADAVTGSFFMHLRNLPALEDLTLVDCASVVDGSLIHIKGKTLKSICLQNTRVTDAGLVDLYGLPVLADVESNGSQVTDAGGRQASQHIAERPEGILGQC